MNEASIEQKAISIALKNNNVIADSVAGSGKTTTVLHIAKDYFDQNILLLTYNRRLRLETEYKAKTLGLVNLDVNNYHSFAVKLYNKKCYTDRELLKHLETDPEPLKAFAYGMIIIDEAQDMTNLYHRFVCKIISDNGKRNPIICVLGDRYQSIYQFNKADERYIIYADQLLNVNNKPWQKLKLSQSFRVSHEICQFINKCMLGEERMVSNKSGNKPRYIYCDPYSKRPYSIIKEYLKTYKPSDIFILAPSVKTDQGPVKPLVNSLSKDVPIYIPVTDEEKIDEEIVKDKLVFSSFHQVKGLERPVIMVMEFDKGYFDYIAKNLNPYVCPNTLYVACTRSLEHLILIHHQTSDFLPFLNNKLIKDYCQVETLDEVRRNNSIKPYLIKYYNVNDMFSTLPIGIRVIDAVIKEISKTTGGRTVDVPVKTLCKNINVETIDHALSFCDVRITHESCGKNRIIELPLKSDSNPVYEINETAIPAMYEYMNTGQMSIVNHLNKDSSLTDMENESYMMDSDDEEEPEKAKHIQINYDDLTIAKLLTIANKYNCSINKVLHKIRQIKKYDWITEEQLNLCIERLRKHISESAKYKVKMGATKQEELKAKNLNTVIDCIDGNMVYTFNCNNNISAKNLLECAVDMYVFCIYNETENVKTDEIIALEQKYNKYKGLMDIMMLKLPLFQSCSETLDNHELDTIKTIKNMMKLCKIRMIEISNELTNIKDYITFCIFNIATHEIITVSSTLDRLKQMIEFLIIKKFHTVATCSDKEFLEDGLATLNNVINNDLRL